MPPPALAHPPRPRGKLEWIEVGRGLAALGVVLAHYSVIRPGVTIGAFRPLGGYSVEFFFVLSGFIIFHVHGEELGRPEAVWRYLWRRFVRVFPTYWLILTLALLARPFQPSFQHSSLGISGILNEYFLAPDRFLVIGQAWTLRHEILFYVIFGAALLNRRIGLSIFMLWMAASAANLILYGLPPGQVIDPLGILVHHYNLDFLLGLLIALALRADKIFVALGLCLAAAVPPAVILATSDHPDVLARVLLYKPVFAALLIVAIIMSKRNVRAPRLLVMLGAASYALYISHELTGSVSAMVLRHVALNPVVGLLLRAAVAILFACIFHAWIERPMLKALRRVPASLRRLRGDREPLTVAP